MMNTKILTALFIVGLLLSSQAQADLATTYSYSTMPAFSGGGGFYVDDGHSGPAGVFDSGDLNDLVKEADETNPVYVGSPIVAWDPTPLPVDITFDLGGSFDVNKIEISSYVHQPFALGAPNSVNISFSEDNLTYGGATTYTFTSITGMDQTFKGYDFLTGVTGTGRYVKLAFDGLPQTTEFNNFDKFSLHEVAIDGTVAVPEPSTAIVLGLVGLAGLSRRRRA